MPHHDSTPQTVLEAPAATAVNVHPANGLNRRERRHPHYVTAKRHLDAHEHRNTPLVGDVRDLTGETRRVSKSRTLGKKA